MGTEVLVVQHGDKVRSAGDPGLTAVGRQQAATVAAWLVASVPDVGSVWASPLRRSRETAAPIAAAFELEVGTDPRLRERMNWDDETALAFDDFVAEWHRASEDRWYRPAIGDSSDDAATRFLDAVLDLAEGQEGTVVVVAHGGVTVDTLRTLVGDDTLESARPGIVDDGVPCGAITRLRVEGDRVVVEDFPSTSHLDTTTSHRPG